MKVGLLWYDDDRKRTLTEKITKAARHYRHKYGTSPNTCYVHHSALSGNETTQVAHIQVASLPTILRHHLWIGQEEQL